MNKRIIECPSCRGSGKQYYGSDEDVINCRVCSGTKKVYSFEYEICVQKELVTYRATSVLLNNQLASIIPLKHVCSSHHGHFYVCEIFDYPALKVFKEDI